MSSAYQSETDGQTEVLNRFLEGYLSYSASKKPHKLGPLGRVLDNSTHHINWSNPFWRRVSRKPPKLIKFLSNETKVVVVALGSREWDEVIAQLKLQLTKAWTKMKRYADKTRHAVNFQGSRLGFSQIEVS